MDMNSHILVNPDWNRFFYFYLYSRSNLIAFIKYDFALKTVNFADFRAFFPPLILEHVLRVQFPQTDMIIQAEISSTR